MKKLLALLVLTLIFSGCGSSKDNATGGGGTPTTNNNPFNSDPNNPFNNNNNGNLPTGNVPNNNASEAQYFAALIGADSGVFRTYPGTNGPRYLIGGNWGIILDSNMSFRVYQSQQGRATQVISGFFTIKANTTNGNYLHMTTNGQTFGNAYRNTSNAKCLTIQLQFGINQTQNFCYQ